MGRQRNQRLFKRGERLELDIIDLAFGGKGIAKIKTDDGDFVCFVENTLPGQKVLVTVHKCKKKHAECKLVEVLEKSDAEVETPYQTIPGAPYAQLPIEQQEKNKKKTCFELFKRIGNIEDIESYYDEYISSPSVWHYRNKMEYSFSAIRYDFDLKHDVDDFAFGFKHRGTWWMVENLEKDSGLFDAELENAFPKLRQFFVETGLAPWHPPKKEGFFRFLVARKSYANNQILLNLVTTSTDLEQFDMNAFVEVLKETLGNRFAGLLHTINDSIGDRIQASDGRCKLVYGEDKIVENLLGLDFEISMQSFFQTNPECAEKLYQKVIDYVQDTEEMQEVIMDLFCGTGTIGQIIANQILLNLVTTSTDLEQFDMNAFVEALKETLGNRFAGLLHTINDSIGDRIQASDGRCKLIYGEDKIVENLLGLDFEISMQSFFQTNPECAEKLYQKVIDYVQDTEEKQEVIMDLFCGTGTIGQIIANQIPGAEVIGVDIVPEAIKDAKKNAKRNNVEGLKFFAADVGKFLQEYPQYKGNISTVVLDPPRAGIAPKTLKKVVQLNSSRIVYVSCNPATQARDTEYLLSEGYKLKKLSFADQFPHTSHVEAIALFEK